MTKGIIVRRLVLLVALLAAAVAGCRSAQKNEPVGNAEPSRWKMPSILTDDKWWKKGEMGDVEL